MGSISTESRGKDLLSKFFEYVTVLIEFLNFILRSDFVHFSSFQFVTFFPCLLTFLFRFFTEKNHHCEHTACCAVTIPFYGNSPQKFMSQAVYLFSFDPYFTALSTQFEWTFLSSWIRWAFDTRWILYVDFLNTALFFFIS